MKSRYLELQDAKLSFKLGSSPGMLMHAILRAACTNMAAGRGSQLKRKLHISKLQIPGFHVVYLSVSIPTILHYEHVEQQREAVQTAFYSFCMIPDDPRRFSLKSFFFLRS